MSTTQRILIVGATGYLGLNLIEQLLQQNRNFKAVARSKLKLLAKGVADDQIVEAQVTERQTLRGVCDEVDVVISCLGITRQRDGLTYESVDYQANLNVLEEAERSGVSKFVYISAFNAQHYPNVRLLRAKEQFAQRLLASEQLTPYVIRPNGFFSDLEEIYEMASKGKVYLFGKGDVRVNPIHGEDLANYCLDVIDNQRGNKAREFDVGGPEVLSTEQMAKLAFQALGKQDRITMLPDFIRKFALYLSKKLPEKWGGPVEFFLTMMEQDAIAPSYGSKTLAKHYADLIKPRR